MINVCMIFQLNPFSMLPATSCNAAAKKSMPNDLEALEDQVEAPRPAPRAAQPPPRGKRMGSRSSATRQAKQLSEVPRSGAVAHAPPEGGHTSQALQPPSPEAPDPIPLTAELEALIGKTLREIQVLENQEKLWSQPEPDLQLEFKAEQLQHSFSKVNVPSPPQIPRAKRPPATGAREAEEEAVEHCRRFLAEACRPHVKIRMAYPVPHLEVSQVADMQLRRPFENSLESMSFNPLEFRIRSRSVW
ncbi:unnamed protein product [Symbiodinium natans]|uniref:Uncharacterized protein n=1 Tax=Symbiodinium natans TaxID=878477 RepID=A0A812S061_9DINO|nr:unnamed protein product [Symbiodinium natans]